ncbi:xylulokinase [Anaerotaenia torta]|uniref:FGGY-family carbohydrate kinase n=1 Tax=Anaerotaenia torta TaxID=433293 RepID=UPI003D19C70D
MEDEKFFIGIDIGTTHIKSAVFHGCGKLLALARETTPAASDEHGPIYDPLKIYGIVKNQLRQWLEQYGPIQGISVTGMAEAGLMMNKVTNKEETPVLPWFDQRTAELSAGITKEEEYGYFKRTGLRNSYKYGIYKYLWLLERSRVRKEDTLWLSICDYIAWKLTGSYATDPSFAARTYVYDIVNHGWDIDRLSGYGLTPANFPTVLCAGETVGYLSEPELMPMSNKTAVPVCIGGHDHVCAAYAVLSEERNRICNSIGTAETYLGVDEYFSMSKEGYDSGMVYGPFFNRKEYFWMANISSSGQSLSWFCRQLQMEEISYSKMNELVAALGQEPTDILFYPYLSGIGTPLFRSDVSGAILGLREGHDAGHVIKAIMEGINYQGKWILSLVPGMDAARVKDVVCVGGAVNSAPWMQIKANVLGIPVTVPGITEASLLGTVAVMIEQNCGREEKKLFLEESRKKNGYYQVHPGINIQYEEIYKNKYAFLADKFLN